MNMNSMLCQQFQLNGFQYLLLNGHSARARALDFGKMAEKSKRLVFPSGQ
jgi:hypothetical protein